MNESESFNPTVGAGSEDLRGEVQSLRFMLSMSLLLMFVFSFCVFVYMFKQTTSLRRQVHEIQDQIVKFEAAGGPTQAAELMLRLGEYAKTHPDYVPIYQKYSQQISVRQVPNQPAKK